MFMYMSKMQINKARKCWFKDLCYVQPKGIPLSLECWLYTVQKLDCSISTWTPLFETRSKEHWKSQIFLEESKAWD